MLESRRESERKLQELISYNDRQFTEKHYPYCTGYPYRSTVAGKVPGIINTVPGPGAGVR